MNQIFTFAGVSRKHTELRLRTSTRAGYADILTKEGHTDVDIVALPSPLSKGDAVLHLLNSDFVIDNDEARTALVLEATRRKLPGYVAVKPTAAAPAEEAPSEEAPTEEPLAEAPSEEAPTEEPLAEAPSEEAPTEEPLAEAPSEEAPAEDDNVIVLEEEVKPKKARRPRKSAASTAFQAWAAAADAEDAAEATEQAA